MSCRAGRVGPSRPLFWGFGPMRGPLMAVDVEYLYCSKAAIDAVPAAKSAVSSAVSLALSFVSAGPSAAVCAFVSSSYGH